MPTTTQYNSSKIIPPSHFLIFPSVETILFRMDFFDKKCVVVTNFKHQVLFLYFKKQNLFIPFQNESREQETQT